MGVPRSLIYIIGLCSTGLALLNALPSFLPSLLKAQKHILRLLGRGPQARLPLKALQPSPWTQFHMAAQVTRRGLRVDKLQFTCMHMEVGGLGRVVAQDF